MNLTRLINNPRIVVVHDWSEYPIQSIEQFGDWTKLHIGGGELNLVRDQLEEALETVAALEKAEKEWDAERKTFNKAIADKEEKTQDKDDQITAAFVALEDFGDFSPDYSESLAGNIVTLAEEIAEKWVTPNKIQELEEEISELKIDNQSLMEQIKELKEELQTYQEIRNP